MKYYQTYKKEQFSFKLLKETKKLSLKPTTKEIEKYIMFIRKHFRINAKLTIKLKDELGVNKGVYLKYRKTIIFYGEPDLLTVLHEIRHFIQLNTKIIGLNVDIEEEARAWSSSLFYSVFPDEYLKLTKEGKIVFV